MRSLTKQLMGSARATDSWCAKLVRSARVLLAAHNCPHVTYNSTDICDDSLLH